MAWAIPKGVFYASPREIKIGKCPHLIRVGEKCSCVIFSHIYITQLIYTISKHNRGEKMPSSVKRVDAEGRRVMAAPFLLKTAISLRACWSHQPEWRDRTFPARSQSQSSVSTRPTAPQGELPQRGKRGWPGPFKSVQSKKS